METIITFDQTYLESKFKKTYDSITNPNQLIFLDYGGYDTRTSLKGSFSKIDESINIFCLWSGTRESMKPQIIGNLNSVEELGYLQYDLHTKNRNARISNFLLSSLYSSKKIGITTLTIYPRYITQPTIKWISKNYDLVPVTFNQTKRRFEDM